MGPDRRPAARTARLGVRVVTAAVQEVPGRRPGRALLSAPVVQVGLQCALLPVIYLAIRYGGLIGFGVEQYVSIIGGIGLVVLTHRHPFRSLQFLMCWYASFVLVLSLIHDLGVPAGIVRQMTGVKEAMAIALLASAARHARRTGHRFDRLDRLGIGFLVLVVVYTALGPLIEVTNRTVEQRMTGARDLAIVVVFLLTVRWLAPDARQVRRLQRTALALIVIIALGGLWQWTNPDAFADRLLVDFGMYDYFRDVAGLSGPALDDQVVWLHLRPLRISSFLHQRIFLEAGNDKTPCQPVFTVSNG